MTARLQCRHLAQGYGALQPAVGLTALGALLQSTRCDGGTPAVVMASSFMWHRFLSGMR